jgi:hypothetical protein
MNNPVNVSETGAPAIDESGMQYQEPLAADLLRPGYSPGDGIAGSEGLPLAQPISIAPGYRRSLFRR